MANRINFSEIKRMVQKHQGMQVLPKFAMAIKTTLDFYNDQSSNTIDYGEHFTKYF